VPAGRALAREEALARLTERFFASHGPATIKDFVWWSGLTVQDARSGIAAVTPKLASEVVSDRTYYFALTKAAVPAATPTGFLLPNYDEYLVGYKDRDAGVSTIVAQRLFEGKFDAYAHPLVLDGKLAGTWRRDLNGKAARVSVAPFARLSHENGRRLDAATERFAKFLGMPAEWRKAT
jgi:hypothetical protein